MHILKAMSVLALVFSSAAIAADYPAPKEGDWVARDFKFHAGQVLPELKLHYTTIGEPAGAPVVVLHGTSQSAQGVLTPAFAGELFGPGEPLDAAKYFIIIPDALGMAKAQSLLTALRPNSRNTITPIWSKLSIDCSQRGSASSMCG